MEIQRHYPIQTFDPLLRDLVGWGLVERQDEEGAERWQLVPDAQRRLDELLSPTQISSVGADVYLNRLCGRCHQRGLTRLREESYLCDTCLAERPEAPEVELTPSSPVEHGHFWRRNRQRQAAPLAS
jgi:hypothetical protein